MPLGEKWKAQQWESTAEVRQAFLELVATGLTAAQAREKMGIEASRYTTWRRRYPDWKAELDRRTHIVRTTKITPDKIELGADSTFADKRFAYFGFQSYWHHHRIIEAIETAPAGGITLILVPPEHGKSTLVSDWVSCEIAEKPNVRIAYVSEGLGLSRKACGRQQRRLEPDGAIKFPRLHTTFGPFHEEGRDTRPWTTDYFTVCKADHDEQDYTFEARGWKSAIAGSRVDVLIVDDIQSRKSLVSTIEMIETFRQDFLSRVGREGKVIVIGTRVGEKDVYQALIDNDMVDRLVMLPATTGEIVECPLGKRCDLPNSPHEKPLCPEMWPIHDLARKRKMVGENAWWRNYQQKPRNAIDCAFSEEMVAQARNDLLTQADCKPRRPGYRRFAGLDPSLTGGNSLLVAEADGARIRVLDCDRHFNLTSVENILELIEQAWRRWEFTDIIIEVNAFQKALGNDERLKAIANLRGFRVHPHTTGINKLDPDFGVAKMPSTFKDGLIEWPWGDDAAKSAFTVLETELCAWREGVPTRKLRQDTVMSLWFCWQYWQKRRKAWLEDDSAQVFSRPARTGLPWAIQGYEAVKQLAGVLR